MLEDIIRCNQERRKADAKRFRESDDNLCMLCHAYGEDKRSLFISCFYAVEEAVPEAIDLFDCGKHLSDRGYYLRICKSCRARFLGMLREWRNECVSLRDLPKDHDGIIEGEDPDRNIPVRVNGITVMMTKDEYDLYSEAMEQGRA